MRCKITCIIAFTASIWPVFTANAVGGCGANTVNCITPNFDSTSSVQITKADGITNVFNVDTTNARVGIGTTTPNQQLDVNGNINAGSAYTNGYYINNQKVLGMPGVNTNLAIGIDAMTAITTGTHNTSIGPSAGQYITSGRFNIAQGYGALQGSSTVAITGQDNIALGSSAGQYIASGMYNVAHGYNALMGSDTTPVSGWFNVAIGSFAGQNISSGRNNIAIGSSAIGGTNEVSGYYNVGIGSGAGQNISSGYYNIAQGYNALAGSSGSPITGSYNLALGYNASKKLSSGASNVVIGNGVGSTTLATGSNNILIGTSSAVDTTAANSNNQLNIGNTIYGDLANARIGIGSATINSGASLDLSSRTDSVLLPNGTTAQRPTAAAGMLRYNSTNSTLEAYYNSNWNTLLGSTSTTGYSGTTILGASASATSPQINGDATSGLYSDTASTIQIATAGSERLRVTATGSIGVGTTTPSVSLDLGSKTDAILLPKGDDTARPTGVAGLLRYNTTSNAVEAYNGSAWSSLGGSSSVTLGTSASATSPQRSGEAGTGLFSSATNKVSIATGGTERLTIDSTGKVGIGVAAPLQALDVTGNINAGTDNTSAYYIGNNKFLAMPLGDTTSLALGYGAMPSMGAATNQYNVAVGQNVLKATTGTENTGVGYQALQANTTGAYNSAFGARALYSNQIATGNSAFGRYALYKTTGPNNTAIGQGAGYSVTGGTNNTIIGYYVASTTLTTGVNNILIGTSNAVDTPLPGFSNFLNIGNTIYGDLTNKRIGIGSSTINSGASLDLSSRTDSLLLPNGTTAQRPTAAAGMIRYNTSTGALEAYNGTSWGLVGDKGGTPTISSCGTGASVTGNDSAFKVTVGTGSVTTCTINLSTTWAAAPSSCVFSAGNAAAAGAIANPSYTVYISTLSTTQFALTSSTSIASAVFYVQCR